MGIPGTALIYSLGMRWVRGCFLVVAPSVAQVSCCAEDGSRCYRHVAGECMSGHHDELKKTWTEADAICRKAGYRLCKSQAELDKCCGSGCNYDYNIVWSSIKK